MTLVRMLAFRPASSAVAGAGAAGAARPQPTASVGSALPSPGVAPIVRPASLGAIDPVQWSRVIGDLDVTGAARQLATNCALIEHQGNILRLAIDPKVARTAPQIEKLNQALAKYLGKPVKLEFVDAATLPVETPAQNGERRSAEALEAARQSLEEDPTVREMKTRFGAKLHPESVRPTE